MKMVAMIALVHLVVVAVCVWGLKSGPSIIVSTIWEMVCLVVVAYYRGRRR